eukprot:Pgem_evm1s1112
MLIDEANDNGKSNWFFEPDIREDGFAQAKWEKDVRAIDETCVASESVVEEVVDETSKSKKRKVDNDDKEEKAKKGDKVKKEEEKVVVLKEIEIERPRAEDIVVIDDDDCVDSSKFTN